MNQSVVPSSQAVVSRRRWLGVAGLLAAVLAGVALMIWAAGEARDTSTLSSGDGPGFPIEIGESAQADAPRPEPTAPSGGAAAAGGSPEGAGEAAAPPTPAPSPAGPGGAADGSPDSSEVVLEVDLQVGELGIALPTLVIEHRPDAQLSATVDVGGLKVVIGP